VFAGSCTADGAAAAGWGDAATCSISEGSDTALLQLRNKRASDPANEHARGATPQHNFVTPRSPSFRTLHCRREDTLTQLFLSSVRRGKEAEACLAAKALGLHVTTLGASTASEGIYQEVGGRQ